jgi:hypothetical protein
MQLPCMLVVSSAQKWHSPGAWCQMPATQTAPNTDFSSHYHICFDCRLSIPCAETLLACCWHHFKTKPCCSML